ncbi:MAG: sulfotransferase [Planctomycetaceae bacterium]
MAYLFVGGSQRTGTSLAQQLLCQLPNANPYLYEASYLRQLVSCYSETRNNFNRNHASYFGTVQSLRNFSSGVVRAFLENASGRLGSPEHLILKEPHLTLYWPWLFELIPEAMFLMMVRDPRDAIASMVQVGERQREIGQNYLFVNRDILQLSRHFLSFYEPAFAVSDDEFRNQLAVVHYEKLVTDPVQTLSDIAGFTGLSFDQIDPFGELDNGLVSVDANANSRMYAPWVTDVSGKKVSRQRIGNYAQVLTAAEVVIIERECADFLEWFGYDRRAAS